MRFKKILPLLVLPTVLILTAHLCLASDPDNKAPAKNLSSESWGIFKRAYAKVLTEYVDPKTPEEVMNGALEGLAKAGGPECAYIPPEDKGKYLSALSHGPSLPLYVTKDSDFAIVLAYYTDLGGKVKPGDSLRFIGDLSTYDMNYPQIMAELRKARKGPVKCTFINRESWKSVSVTISAVLPEDPTWTPLNGGGALAIPCLESNLDPKVADQVNKAKGTIIIDLRGSASDDSETALKWLGVLLGPGMSPECQRGKKKSSDPVTGPGYVKGKPLVVLVDKTTARAGEVLASGLISAGAVSAGEKTFGWAPKIENFPLDNGGIIRLITAYYLKPDGSVMNDSSMVPEHEIKRAEQEEAVHFYDRALKAVKQKKGKSSNAG